MRSLSLLALLGISSAVSAQAPPQCFGGDVVRSVPMKLGGRITLDAACEYARDASGPFRSLAGRDRVVGALDGLGWQPGDSTTVYGRRRDATDEVSSVFIDHCADYLLAPGGAFRVTPAAVRGALDVTRVSARCGAAALQLNFECPASRGPEPVRLPISQTRQTLPPCTAGWRVQASPAGGRAYPLGRLAAGGETPLQSYFAQGGEHALLRPDWAGAQGLRFAPSGDATLWEELRAALSAGSARIVRKAGVSSRAACAGEGEPVDINVSHEGVTLDPRYLAREMTASYGEDGTRFAPALSRIKALAGELHVCLAASYGVRPVGTSMTGVAFMQLATTDAIGERFAGAEVCVQHQSVRITPEGPRPQESARQCVAAGETGLLVATAGSVLEVPEGTIACRGRENIAGEDHSYVLPRGFVDVRVETHGGCGTLETASLMRVGVVDPGRDWIPVGLGRISRGATSEALPAWRGVRVDDPVTFARVRRRDALRFRITTPEGFASAWNHPARGATTAVSRFAPVVGSEEGDFGHARPPAFSTRISGSPECALGDDAELVAADDVLIDEVVYAHLIIDDGRSPRCLASAAFRAWEPRVLTNVGRSQRRQLRLGLLGDARVGVFISKPDPGAIGALLPILYTDLHLKHGFVFELSIPITAAIAWEDGGGSRVGGGVMAAMNWGIPNLAPRLFTVGFLIQPPWPHPDDEVWSFFFGVNVASLIDLAGGR